MIHLIYNVKENKIAKFTTNVSLDIKKSLDKSKINYNNNDDDSNVISNCDASMTIQDFFNIMYTDENENVIDEVPIEFGLNNKQFIKQGRNIFIYRNNDLLIKYKISDNDDFLEIDVTDYDIIIPMQKTETIYLSGFIKSHGRFRMYYHGKNNV
jgi:hypothetical protein